VYRAPVPAECGGDVSQYAGLQHPNGEQRRMAAGEAAKDDRICLHDIPSRVSGRRYPVELIAALRQPVDFDTRPLQLTMSTRDDHMRRLHEAEFAEVGERLHVMDGAVSAWIAR
jgi:hypothetical protein